ncbi:hypothetical protein K474DRAFT_1229720 [Panus rudis PR-1116 ss-1]|nr:hypothetical protein K474DRAFT_1229720 [Panus rudis PR-1116 ss-1]
MSLSRQPFQPIEHETLTETGSSAPTIPSESGSIIESRLHERERRGSPAKTADESCGCNPCPMTAAQRGEKKGAIYCMCYWPLLQVRLKPSTSLIRETIRALCDSPKTSLAPNYSTYSHTYQSVLSCTKSSLALPRFRVFYWQIVSRLGALCALFNVHREQWGFMQLREIAQKGQQNERISNFSRKNITCTLSSLSSPVCLPESQSSNNPLCVGGRALSLFVLGAAIVLSLCVPLLRPFS